MLEQLETRRMMAVTTGLANNTLYVWGDAQSNGISIQKEGVNLVVRTYQGAAGYQPIYSVFAAGVAMVRVYGYDGNDTIGVGQAVTNRMVIQGGRGGDIIEAGGGITDVYGHGNFVGDPTGSHDPAFDDGGADHISAGNGAGWNRYWGQGGNDTFYTKVFNSIPTGQTNQLIGEGGHDTFNFYGNQVVQASGSSGNETFKFGPQNQRVSVDGGSGFDTADYAGFGAAVFIDSNPQLGHDDKSGALNGARNQKLNYAVERFVGSALGDVFSGTFRAENFVGNGGNDWIVGDGGADVLDAGDGNDTIYGGDNNDSIIAGNGNDSIAGLAGNDAINGGAGNDTVYAGDGNDTVAGGSGNDILHGQGGNDVLYGESGGDHLYAGGGSNLLVGGSESDYLYAKNSLWLDTIIGDNVDGSGFGGGAYDIAVVDLVQVNGVFQTDTRIGVENVAYN